MNSQLQKSENACLSCGSADWYENHSFGALPRVTSDSTPFPGNGRIGVCLHCGLIQKATDDLWKKEIDQIYKNYKMYELTAGADQILFGENGVTRGQKLVEILSEHIPASFAGSVLDIGCGTGGFLEACGKKYPKAELYGQEIDDKNRRYLERIPNFKGLFTGTAFGNRKFNLITSIHCLEHIYDYENFFEDIKRTRADSTLILFEVPDIEHSPFDLVIADHAAHFSKNTLHRCLQRFLGTFDVSQLIHKELTAISRKGMADEVPPLPVREACIRDLNARVDHLVRLLSGIAEKKPGEFGVYGTTIAGAWITAAYRESIAFYIDDDPLKQGKSFHGKNIIAANQAPKHIPVLMPFDQKTIGKIRNRYPDLQPLDFHDM